MKKLSNTRKRLRIAKVADTVLLLGITLLKYLTSHKPFTIQKDITHE